MAMYAPDMTMERARALYFEANGFGEDGGYNKKVDWFELGPLRLPIPNPPARRKALLMHDANHVLTEYATDWRGEFEIAGYEVGTGCGRVWIGWALNLGGMAVGMALMPRRVIKAFYRGRQARSIYTDPDPQRFLKMRVGEARAELEVDGDAPPTPRDRLALLGWTGVAALVGIIELAVLFAPAGLAAYAVAALVGLV